MIKPTIGRVMWYWPLGAAPKREDSQPYPAIVVFVHSDYCVNLAVFDCNGDPRPYQCVSLWQGDGERPHEPHCEWMPYQKGQAAQADVDKVALKEDVRVLQDRVKYLEAYIASTQQHIKPVVSTPAPPAPPATSNTTEAGPRSA